MRFRKLDISRSGFGAAHATRFLRAGRLIFVRITTLFINIFLINAVILNAQISPPGHPARPAAPATAQLTNRIIPMLARLADQANLSGDFAFAVRSQSQAATLLWQYDREQARAIYRRAFQSLAVADESEPDGSATLEAASVERSSRPTITAIARQQLRVELLGEIAARDAELAEDLACALTAPVAGSSAGCAGATMSGKRVDDNGPVFDPSPTTAPTQRDVECRDLLVGVALRMVERDLTRAMALARLSLAFGVSQHFSRLLLSLRALDAGRADLLFAKAVGRLERSRVADLNDIRMLGVYLVSATDPGAKEGVNRGVVVRFLNCALAQLARRGHMPAGGIGEGHAHTDNEATIYFIGRQLGDLFARYRPDRLGQFKRKIAELTARNSTDRVIDPASVYASSPNSIAREASAASTAEGRDLLYARAAFAWLVRGEVNQAQAAAAKVAAAAIRDRLMVRIARRHNSEGRLEGAVAVARRIDDAAARASTLASVAVAALAAKGEARATNLLDEAAGYALKARPSIARARALVGIARSFTAFDAMRGFEVMQAAVKAINEALGQKEASGPARSDPNGAGEFGARELCSSGLEAALAALGRVDFDRALFLAQQLASRDISVLAQLAVCRGGLASQPSGERAANEKRWEPPRSLDEHRIRSA